MKVWDVPQDYGAIGNQKEVCYAVDEEGRYVLTPSLGWDPKNIANSQAWEAIHHQIALALKRIHAGKASPLAYHMARNQMNPGLLAKYVGLFRWQVYRHLKPGGYRRMSPRLKLKYAELFETTPEWLDHTE